MAWFRWHEGTTSDPKFHLIARKSGQPVVYAIAVWACLLERASEAPRRGDIDGFDCESVDAALGMPDGATQAIVDAMTAKGMIADGRIANWEKRQPAREDATSAERKERWKEKHKNAPERERTPENNMERAGTQKNAPERERTPDKIRIDKSIKENIKNPPISPLGECGGDGDGEFSQTCPPEEEPQQEPQDEPGIEFLELRDFCDREMRCEGPLAGFREYKALKKARDSTGMSCWPGLGAICDDILKRKAAHIWNPGYEIGLGRYLAEKTWLAPIVARASPLPAQAREKKSEGDIAAQKTWETYQRLQAQGVVE